MGYGIIERFEGIRYYYQPQISNISLKNNAQINNKYNNLSNEPRIIIKLNTAKERKLCYQIHFPTTTKIYRTE